ncbi:MAG: DUF4280 domain-containing protein [Holosporales bacterium]
MGTPSGCMGACLLCPFSLPPKPTPMNVLPTARVMVSKKPMARITDMVPMLNIVSFGMCVSPTNPTFIALTAAALGVPTPAPCIPVPAGPWIPSNPTVLVGKIPVQGVPSVVMCAWAAPITTTIPGQFQVLS